MNFTAFFKSLLMLAQQILVWTNDGYESNIIGAIIEQIFG